MNLREIEEQVLELDSRGGTEFLYALLRAYGVPKASVSRLRSGAYDKSDASDEVLWRGKVYFRTTELDDAQLYAAIDSAQSEQRILEQRPRFLILTNANRLLAVDLTAGDTLDVLHDELSGRAAFFLPWAGIEKARIEEVNPADIKAAEKMARLYDEIIRHNTISSGEGTHELNVFFSRLLFCFFAEDTGVFERGSFTNAIASYTRDSGEDLHDFLGDLFVVLNTPSEKRDTAPAHLRAFGYVNGQLFARNITPPRFSTKARKVILECGTLDWSQINPDIFGSMIQAVVHPSQREGLGMHYTSVENIMKVIRPLFLDELEAELAACEAATSGAGSVSEARRSPAKAVAKFDRFMERLSQIQVFDPACGSGNFLIIAYKELRRLEHVALQRIAELDPSRVGLFKLSQIELDSFYGIEIDDFAHEIAILSLWLAKHQMNLEFKELFGAEIPLIPLQEAGNIVCQNAVRMAWQDFCDASQRTTYVLGNPPYAGSSMQSQSQKGDFASFFGTHKYPRNLDYVALWFLKGAAYLEGARDSRLGFVSTNSISQGDHTGLMWPRVLSHDVVIAFAYLSFLWGNQARGKAGVSCVIVGLARSGQAREKALYGAEGRKRVDSISPYLRAGHADLVVHSRRTSIGHLPPMVFGSKPTDNGHLNMDSDERAALVRDEPAAARFLRRYMGAAELLNGRERYCIWVEDAEAGEAARIRDFQRRFDLVSRFRSNGSKPARAMASRPYRFLQRAHRPGASIIVPSVSSERREYIPMGFLDGDTVISNAANAIYEAELWVFGLIQSRMHMVWVHAVAGRLESRYRYSSVLVYNTFPVPDLTDSDRQALRGAAVAVLGAREQFPGYTLAELYDPQAMPGGLREAHRGLDSVVDHIYRTRPFDSDEDRLKLLFEMYEVAAPRGSAVPINA